MSALGGFEKSISFRNAFSGNREFNLPGLVRAKSPTNMSALPRRYEETKPVRTQNVTHKDILGIGERINLSVAEKYEAEKQAALKEVEKNIWHEAEALKVAAVNDAMMKLGAEHKKELRDQMKTYERALKEESLRMSLQLQRQAKEQLTEQQAAAKRSLQEAIAALHHHAEADRLHTVDAVRHEEQQRCAQEVSKITENAALVLGRTVERLAAEKERAVAELHATRRAEAEAAERRHMQAMEALQQQLEALQAELAAQEAMLREEVERRQRSVAELVEMIAAESRKEAAVVRELRATQLDKRAFTERTSRATSAADREPSRQKVGSSVSVTAYQICADR